MGETDLIRAKQIIRDLPLLNKRGISLFANFLRCRLMAFGVLDDERKQQFDFTERFGDRPWLSPEAMKLKVELADAVEVWKGRPSRVTEDVVRSLQQELMQHLRAIHEHWEAKMRSCRGLDEHMLEKTLNPGAPPAKKAKLFPARPDVYGNQWHAPQYWDRAGQVGGNRQGFPDLSPRAPHEHYSSQHYYTGEMPRAYPPEPRFGPGEQYSQYVHRNERYYDAHPYGNEPDFHYADDRYARGCKRDIAYQTDRIPYAHGPYQQFNEPMDVPPCSHPGAANGSSFGGQVGESDYEGRRERLSPPWRDPQSREPLGPPWRDPQSREPHGPAWRNPQSREPLGPPWRDPQSREPPGPAWCDPHGREPSGPPWRDPQGRESDDPPWCDPQGRESDDPSWRDPHGREPSGPPWRDPHGREPSGPPWRDPQGRESDDPPWCDPQGRESDDLSWRDPHSREPSGPPWCYPQSREPPGPSWRDPQGREPPAQPWYIHQDRYPQDFRPYEEQRRFKRKRSPNAMMESNRSSIERRGLVPTGITGGVVRIRRPEFQPLSEGERYARDLHRDSRKCKIIAMKAAAKLNSANSRADSDDNSCIKDVPL